MSQTYYFARDDRVYKAFVDRLDKHQQAINRTCTRRLKWQMRVLRTVMEGRNTNFRVSRLLLGCASMFHILFSRVKYKHCWKNLTKDQAYDLLTHIPVACATLEICYDAPIPKT